MTNIHRVTVTLEVPLYENEMETEEETEENVIKQIKQGHFRLTNYEY